MRIVWSDLLHCPPCRPGPCITGAATLTMWELAFNPRACRDEDKIVDVQHLEVSLESQGVKWL